MCLAIPGKVLSIDTSVQPVMGVVNFGGIEKQVCLELLPEAAPGDYVIVHVGFAISRMDEKEAMETLKLISEIDGSLDELPPPDGKP